MDRRSFLRVGAGGAALVVAQPVLGRLAHAQPAPGPFGHGVASGDPLPDGVILWTRVTPSEDATPGSGLGADTAVTWTVARDGAFASVLASGSVTATASSDHTVHVDVSGLPAATDLWYRFGALGAVSPIGRTRTAPAADADVEALRFGVVSCSNYTAGFFSSYRHLAERDDLDAVLHLGDYLYEGGGGNDALGRRNDPPDEIVTLSDYRRRHALYKTDPDLVALHGRYPWIVTLDDHEVTNNSWADGADNHQADEGIYSERKAAALQAYFEWMPLRRTGGDAEPTRIYRRLSYGGLADLFVLDERGYRSKQLEGFSESLFVSVPEVDDPSRTMLGAEQRSWLDDGLAASAASWKVVLNSVMFAPLVLVDLPDVLEVGALLQTALTALGVGLPVAINGDQWDGYRAEQRALTTRYGETSGSVVILTGDIHSSWAAEIPADPGTYLPGVGGVTNAVEFVTPAVTSGAFSGQLDSLGIPGGAELAPALPVIVGAAAPWFKYLDAERHGFGVFEVNATHAQYDWYHLSDRTDPRATATVARSFRTPVGTNRLEAAAPLAARAPSEPAVEVPAPTAPTPPDPEPAGQRLPATGSDGPALPTALLLAGGLATAALRRRSDRQEGPSQAS